MSRQYHYLVAGLPDIFIDDKKLSFNSHEFRDLLVDVLPVDHVNIIKLLFWRLDNLNVLAKLEKKENITGILGNLDEQEIDNLLNAVKEDSFSEKTLGIPEYFGKFIEAFKEDTPVIAGKRWDVQLSELFYEYALSVSNDFVTKWFRFERDLNNLLTASKCKKYNVPIDGQLIGSGELVDKLSRSSSKDFGLDNEFPFLDQILKALDENDFLEQEKKFDRIKWDYLNEEVFFHYFTIEKIFAFLVQLTIVERWLSLDKETGQELFNELINNLEASYEFPEEFQLK
jgi:hypothetical protein